MYHLIQEKKHLTEKGQEKILKIKASMNKFSKETFDIDSNPS